MDLLRVLFKNESALAVSLIEAVLAVAIAFGLDLSGEQVAALVALMVPVGALVTRAQVWTAGSVDREKAKAYADGQRDAQTGGDVTGTA